MGCDYILRSSEGLVSFWEQLVQVFCTFGWRDIYLLLVNVLIINILFYIQFNILYLYISNHMLSF